MHVPGVYCSEATVTLTDTTLTLDAQGDANAVWIFRIGTGGTGALTGTNLSAVMTNGGQPCNVYWWVAEAVTMTTSGFQGIILAGAKSAACRGTLAARAETRSSQAGRHQGRRCGPESAPRVPTRRGLAVRDEEGDGAYATAPNNAPLILRKYRVPRSGGRCPDV